MRELDDVRMTLGSIMKKYSDEDDAIIITDLEPGDDEQVTAIPALLFSMDNEYEDAKKFGDGINAEATRSANMLILRKGVACR